MPVLLDIIIRHCVDLTLDEAKRKIEGFDFYHGKIKVVLATDKSKRVRLKFYGKAVQVIIAD